MPTYKIIEAASPDTPGVELRGGVLAFWRCKDHEQIMAGPAETGKTFGGLHKLDTLLWKYPGSQAAIVRKTYKSCVGSVCQTYERKVANMKAVQVLGGTRPERYQYPNGSTIWIGGMDNPDKVLSSERDFIYVNQAEELLEGDWETLNTRATGRAGNAPYALMMGDCNPAGSRHWILGRSASGRLTVIPTTHKDNPTLFDAAGNITEQGRRSLSALEGLSGVRRERLLLGKWATAEGVVYDAFTSETHVREYPHERFVSWALAMDEGYTNPAVILLIGVDGDGRLHVAREFYERGKLQADVVATARTWYLEKHCLVAAVDAAAAGLIADLVNAGIPAEPHKGRVLDGITAVQAALKVQGDGLPRLTIDPSCINTINEFESYVWKPQKDEPVKENDHALDALRYYVVSRLEAGSLVLFGV